MPKYQKVCPSCGHVGAAKTITQGHFAIELILWIAMIIPGVVYSIWRLCSKTSGCACCGNRDLIPANSPVGRQIIAAQTQIQAAAQPAQYMARRFADKGLQR